MAELTAEKRTELGRGNSRVRKAGKLPAVIYGEGVPSTPLSVSARDFSIVFRKTGETSLLTLKVVGDKEYNVLVHDVAKDPITLEPIHADFYAVRMDKPIEAKIPIEFAGESPAVKNEGGILVKVMHELEIKALPKDLPHEIVVDVSTLLKIDDKMHVKDVALPNGVTLLVSGEEVVALIEPPRSEEELEELTKTETAPEVAEVKTEREVKAEAKATEEPEEEGEAKTK